MPSTEVTWTKVISLTRFSVTLSSASTYIVPWSLDLSGKIDESCSYSVGMNERQVLVIMNLLKLSKGQVVSNFGNVEALLGLTIEMTGDTETINFTSDWLRNQSTFST